MLRAQGFTPPIFILPGETGPEAPRREAAGLLSRSPDADAVRGGDIELVARLDVPGLVPGIDVAQRRDRADLAGRVRIADQLLAQRLRPLQRPPDLAPAEED